MYTIMKAVEGEEKEELGRALVAAVEKEIEPLLQNAAPFFGGSGVMTLAEVCLDTFHTMSPRYVLTIADSI